MAPTDDVYDWYTDVEQLVVADARNGSTKQHTFAVPSRVRPRTDRVRRPTRGPRVGYVDRDLLYVPQGAQGGRAHQRLPPERRPAGLGQKGVSARRIGGQLSDDSLAGSVHRNERDDRRTTDTGATVTARTSTTKFVPTTTVARSRSSQSSTDHADDRSPADRVTRPGRRIDASEPACSGRFDGGPFSVHPHMFTEVDRRLDDRRGR